MWSKPSSSSTFSQIETDGVCVSHSKDPPGQRSVYILPGDPERESYRLSTFKDFPRNVPINSCQFAVNGFYYIGYKDRVKCFSCGQSCENWLAGDDISLAVWHKRDCEFKNGTDITNIPIGSLFQTKVPRNNSSNFSTSSTTSTNTERSNINKRNTTLHPTNLFAHSHSSNSNNPSTFHANSSQGVASTSGRSSSTNQITNNRLSEIFPCLHPINPHMRRTEARLQTFIDNSRLWPSYRLRTTPEEIADAGMYFLGERDRVKCWYCNGGLQNWERDDDPWVEHAKWFPMCEYLLQRKGPDFVHRIVAQYPDLRRPTLRNPTTATVVNEISHAVVSNSRFSSASLNRQSESPVIIDPREELRNRMKKADEAMTSSELVIQAKSLGFDDKIIRSVLLKKYETNNDGFSDLSSLIDAILSCPEGELANENIDVEEPSSSSGISRSMSVSNMTPSEEMEEMRRLEESRNCKSCHSNRACMVFIPCGHLACCAECGSDVERCPICNCHVQERIKTFIV